jgi:type I restriction enzyme S subunit
MDREWTLAENDAQGEWTLPDGWTWTSVEQVGVIKSGQTPKGIKEVSEEGDIPWFRVGDMNTSGNEIYMLHAQVNLTEDEVTVLKLHIQPPGTVIFPKRGGAIATNKKRILAKPSAYDLNTMGIIPTELDGKYFWYWFLSINLAELSSGSNVPQINHGDISSIAVPLAPLPEQRRIVAEIETQFTRLDAAVAGLERAQANIRCYKAAVLQAACEGQLVPTEAELAHAEGRDYEPADQLLARILAERRARWEAAHPGKRYKEPAPPDMENLPELPEGWVWANVGQMADVGTGATPLRSNRAYYEDGTIPWVKSSALNDLFVDSAEELITELALTETNVKVFPAGTLLVAMYGEGKTRGKVSELKIDAATNQACAALLFDDLSLGCKPYIKVFFQKNYDDIRRLSSGGVQPNLNLSIIRGTAVPLPPLTEQHRIVAEVERRLSLVAALEASVEAALARAGRLRQAVLKQAFEGRLVPQDPDDEPASVLLERIRAQREARTTAKGKQKVEQMRLPTV